MLLSCNFPAGLQPAGHSCFYKWRDGSRVDFLLICNLLDHRMSTNAAHEQHFQCTMQLLTKPAGLKPADLTTTRWLRNYTSSLSFPSKCPACLQPAGPSGVDQWHDGSCVDFLLVCKLLEHCVSTNTAHEQHLQGKAPIFTVPAGLETC